MQRTNTFGYIALAVACTVYGTTYLFLKIGVETFPPYLFAAIRNTIAGVILLFILKMLKKISRVSTKYLIRQLIIGILMISVGNGFICAAERYIPSGLTALLVSTTPVFVILLNYLSGRDRRFPGKLVVLGLLLECVGMILIFHENLKELLQQSYRNSLLVTFLACIALAFGSVYAKKEGKQTNNVFQDSALQLLLGGAFLFIMSPLLDDYSTISAISSKSYMALAYLTVVGSVIAYPCVIYALNSLPVGVASLYTYVNPFVALLLGYFILSEPLTLFALIALSFTITGLYLINKGYRRLNNNAIPAIKNNQRIFNFK